MRIAVTGGAGFVGTHLVCALLECGHTVLVYDNLFSGRKLKTMVGVNNLQFEQADVTDGRRLRIEFAAFRPEIIFHLAALHYIPYCDQHPEEALRVNLEGTLNLMLAASETRSVKAVLFASSVAVYPPTDHCHAESDPVGPCDIYGLTKWLGEQVVDHYAREAHLAHLSLRFSNLYGPGETNPHVIPAVLEQLLQGEDTLHLGRTDPCRDFLYVEDLVEALLAAIPVVLREEAHGALNLGPGREASVADAVRILGELSGRSVRVLQDETRVRAVERMHLRADIAAAQRLLGWTPRHDLQAGLAKTFAAESRERIRGFAAGL